MSKVYGDKKNIDDARASKSGSKEAYINWDAINDLPDEFEAMITAVEYDPKKLDTSFINVGTQSSPSWYPRTDLMYKIAEACGVSGQQESDVGPMIEEVDINPMLLKGMTDEPTYRRMTVGRLVSKQSSRLMEDGTKILSSNCTSEYNVWERCVEAWSKEEMYTDGYAKQGKFPSKYDNPYKRKAHFDGEMKFAHAKAETKAYAKTIRELAGMPTGFAPSDLVTGKLFFARIRRSKAVLKMETAARIGAISRGVDPQKAQKALFGATSHDEVEEVTIEQEEPEVKTPYPQLAMIFNSYLELVGKDDAIRESMNNIVKWVESDIDHFMDNKKFYKKALDILREVEKSVPEAFHIPHTLYE